MAAANTRRGVEKRARRAGAAMARLVRIMDTLRSSRGCPWDRQQTHETLRPFLLEETYEALDAIDRGDLGGLKGELGDVLFQCVFHAQLTAERRLFDLADALEAIRAKLVRRHPHVFTASGRPLTPARRRGARARTPRAVVEQWEVLKAREQRAAGQPARILAGVPRSLPALLGAHEIGTRVAAVGFDWPAAGDVVAKIEEEVGELREAVQQDPARAAEELGDLLFSIANLARKLGIEPESALRAANAKFTARFDAVEAALSVRGRSVHGASLDELEAAWQTVKASPRPPATPGPTTSPDRSSGRRSPPRRRRRGRSGRSRRPRA